MADLSLITVKNIKDHPSFDQISFRNPQRLLKSILPFRKDPLPVEKAIVASSVKYLNKARVIILLCDHDFTQRKARIHRLFNEAVIEALHKKGDTILVEENRTYPTILLSKNMVANLDHTRFRIKGWDDPEILNKLHKSLNQTKDVQKIHALIMSTYPDRQRSAFNFLKKELEENEGRIFMIMGIQHGNPSNKEHKSLLNSQLSGLNEPYMILNPAKIL